MVTIQHQPHGACGACSLLVYWQRQCLIDIICTKVKMWTTCFSIRICHYWPAADLRRVWCLGRHLDLYLLGTLRLYSKLCKPIKSLVPVKWCEKSFHCSSDQDWRPTILWHQHHDEPIFSSLLALKSELCRWFHTNSGTSNIALECRYFLWILACTTWRWNSSLGINIWSLPFFAVSPWFQISFCQCLINQLWFIGFWSFFGHSALKQENCPFRNLKRN